MNDHLDNTRRQLGELGAMAQQTEAMERRILSIATERLDAIGPELAHARAAAMAGGNEEKQRYTDMVAERGRLEQVIATARAELGTG